MHQKNNAQVRKKHPFNFLLIEAETQSLDYLVLAKMLKHHLNNDKKVLIASPALPKYFMQQLSRSQYDFMQKIESEQMILFSYQASISSNISLSSDYGIIFNEMQMLSGIDADLIILHGVDMLFNLESQNLAYSTVNKFFHAIQDLNNHVIAQFVRHDSLAHQRLIAACASLIPYYFTANQSLEHGKTRIRLKKQKQ